MTRNGKIARLPHEVREQLNQRLRNGENGNNLLEWLNGLPGVQVVLAAEFGGEPISEQNLSRWRQGGYPEWLGQQEAMEDVRRLMSEAKEVRSETEGQFGDWMATWLMARCAAAAGRLMRGEKEDDARDEAFQKLCRNVVSLRKGELYARWIAIERERLEMERKPDPKGMEKQFKEWAMDPKIKREFFPEQLTEEEKEAAWRQIFGLGPKNENAHEKKMLTEGNEGHEGGGAEKPQSHGDTKS